MSPAGGFLASASAGASGGSRRRALPGDSLGTPPAPLGRALAREPL